MQEAPDQSSFLKKILIINCIKMNKPKVMRVISDLPVGGVENRLLALLPKLASKYDIQVCCIRARGALACEFEQAGIPVVLKYFKSRLHPVSLYQLASYMKKQKIDIVHTHMYRPNISGALAAKLAGVPVIISQVHNVDHWDNRRQIFTDSLFCGFRDKVIAVSCAVKNDYIKNTGIRADKCAVIYNGIDMDKFQTLSAIGREQNEVDAENSYRLKLRKKWGISPTDKVVGIIARLVPQKDHLTFINAAKLVYDSIKNVKFLIVGEEENQSGVIKLIKKRANQLGIEKTLVFTGMQREITSVLSIMDVSALSSTKEGFSNVVVESMAAGVPMAATDAGGNAEAVTDGVTGFIVPKKAPKAMAGAIVKILQNDNMAASMSKASRKRAQMFSLSAMCKKTDTLYQTLLAEKS